MRNKSINEWHETDSIDWVEYWKMIDSLDDIIRKNRNPRYKTRGGWYWPEHKYSAAGIFRERFNADGKAANSYRVIAQKLNIPTNNVEQFVSGIIQSTFRIMNHSIRRRQWDLNIKAKLRNEA